MSNPALNWAFAATVTRSSDKFVLVCLANYAADDGVCYPSQAKLIRDTSLDRKTIIAAMKRLCDVGLIIDTGRRKGGTGQIIVYRLALEERHDEGGETVPIFPLTDAETIPNFPPGDGETVPIFPANSPNFPAEESQNSHERVPKTGHGTLKEPSVEPPREPTNACEPIATNLFGEPVASKPLAHIGCNGALTERPPKAREQAAPQSPPLAKPAAKRRAKTTDPTPECLAFWHAYPRKRDGIGSMLAAWDKAITRAPVEVIMAGLARFPFSRDPQFLPMASTWLNRSQWSTEADTVPLATVPGTPDRRLQGAAMILGRPIAGFGLPPARASPVASSETIDIVPGDWNER